MNLSIYFCSYLLYLLNECKKNEKINAGTLTMTLDYVIEL